MIIKKKHSGSVRQRELERYRGGEPLKYNVVSRHDQDNSFRGWNLWESHSVWNKHLGCTLAPGDNTCLGCIWEILDHVSLLTTLYLSDPPWGEIGREQPPEKPETRAWDNYTKFVSERNPASMLSTFLFTENFRRANYAEQHIKLIWLDWSFFLMNEWSEWRT